jgi:hypothetical protein
MKCVKILVVDHQIYIHLGHENSDDEREQYVTKTVITD